MHCVILYALPVKMFHLFQHTIHLHALIQYLQYMEIGIDKNRIQSYNRAFHAAGFKKKSEIMGYSPPISIGF